MGVVLVNFSKIITWKNSCRSRDTWKSRSSRTARATLLFTGDPTSSARRRFRLADANGLNYVGDTQLKKGTARFSFRQGALIKATYAGNKGETAFFDVLKEKDGRFKFTPGLPPEDFDTPEIGYFMKLLMQGMQKVDEEKPLSTN